VRKALLDNLLNEQSNVAVESPSKGEVLSLLSEAAFTNAEVAYMGVEDSQFDIERLVDIAVGLESINESLPVNEIDDVVLAGVNAVVGEVGLEAKNVVEDIKETIRRVWQAMYRAVQHAMRQVRAWLRKVFDSTKKFKERVEYTRRNLETLGEVKDDKPITAPVISAALDIEGNVNLNLIKERMAGVTPLFNTKMVGSIEAITVMVEGLADIDVKNTVFDRKTVTNSAYEILNKIHQVIGVIVLSKKKLPVKDLIVNQLFPYRPVVQGFMEFFASPTQIHSTETLPGNKAVYVLSSDGLRDNERIQIKVGDLGAMARLGSLSLINPKFKIKENKLPVLTKAAMVDACDYVTTLVDNIIYFNDYYNKRSIKSIESMFDAVDKLERDIYDDIDKDDHDKSSEAWLMFNAISSMSQVVNKMSSGLVLDVVRHSLNVCQNIIKYVELSSTRYEDDLDESTLLESK